MRAIFVPLARLARDLGQPGKVNTILIAGELTAPPIESCCASDTRWRIWG